MLSSPSKTLGKAALLTGVLVLSVLALALADTVAGDNVRVNFNGQISPATLPRTEPAPVALHVAGSVHPLGAGRPAALERLTIQVNRHAHFMIAGLPSCRERRLRGTSTREALRACGDALLGRGYFTSHIDIPEQAPFPARGRVLAFNTTRKGPPTIAIHVFGRTPAPIANVLGGALVRSGAASGGLGPRLTIEMPRIGDDWGYVTGFELTLHRRYRYRGRRLSVVSASCPAPPDLERVPFKAARGTFELSDGQTLSRTVGGVCRVRG